MPARHSTSPRSAPSSSRSIRPASCGSGCWPSSPRRSARVIVAAVSYGRDADWTMVAISVAILAVIVVGVATALAVTV